VSEIEKNKSSKVGAWIGAMRLRTLPLSFSVILIGSSVAYLTTKMDEPAAQGPWLPRWEFSWLIFTLTILTTLCLQILSNLANDYGDALKGADNDGRIGPDRAIQSGLISPQSMKKGIIITTIITLISGIWLLLETFEYQFDLAFIVFFLLGVLSIAAAIKYTVGKRAYGYSGFGDIFVFIFFGLLGVIGSYWLQDRTFHWEILLPAIYMGCISVELLNLNNMRDRVNDEKVGKRTFVVHLGFKRSKNYHYLLFIIAYVCFPLILLVDILLVDILIIEGDFKFLIPFAPVAVIHAIHINKVRKVDDPKDFDPELKKIALSAFLFAVLFFATVLIFH
tara:strand:- start:44331 stop:45338 length:1008 start_codon:yes stop_codon:yes gene_type:complete